MELLDFIFLFGCLALLVALGCACRWALQWSDRSGVLPLLPLPSDPDPYEVAYLRGGAGAVAEVAVLALVEAGYLELRQEKRWGGSSRVVAQASSKPPTDLSPMLDRVYRWFDKPRGDLYGCRILTPGRGTSDTFTSRN